MSLDVIYLWPTSLIWRTQYNGSYIIDNVLVSLKHYLLVFGTKGPHGMFFQMFL